MGAYVGVYYLAVDDRQRGIWLVVEVMVDGPATVVGQWDDRADAERDADRWTALAESVAA